MSLLGEDTKRDLCSGVDEGVELVEEMFPMELDEW
jgi:hypothetical protein